MRHVVPIDRQPRTRQIRAASETDPTTIWQSSKLLFPTRSVDHLLDAGVQAHRTNTQIVGRQRVRRNEVLPAHFGGIEAQLIRDLINLNFESESRLRCSMPPLRTTRSLVRKRAESSKPVPRYLVSYSLKRTRIEGRSDAVASIRPAVKK